MIMLARRNLTVFFRDKAAVFFSLLSALIIFGLYIFFLGDLWTSNLESIVNGQEIMDSWLIAGLFDNHLFYFGHGRLWGHGGRQSKRNLKRFLCQPG